MWSQATIRIVKLTNSSAKIPITATSTYKFLEMYKLSDISSNIHLDSKTSSRKYTTRLSEFNGK